ncbi:MAG: ABC transporter permease, partial [Verrucomicrobiota bacterium]
LARYILLRFAMLIGILFGVMIVTFVISRVLPGSPVEMMLGSRPTQEQIDQAKEELGLNDPIYVQLWNYTTSMAQGDLGKSFRTGQPVTTDLSQRYPATVELVTLGLGLAVLFGIPLGVIAATKRGKLADPIIRVFVLSGMAMPVFFLGILLQLIFAGNLQLLPLQGRINAEVLIDHPFKAVTGFYLIDSLLAGDLAAFRSALAHLLLPALTLALASLAIVTRVTRNLMNEVLSEDHIMAMRSYGMPNRRIHFYYALKATCVPLLTVIGLTFGFMLGGSIIVEYVFDWPGLGGYIVSSLLTSDFNAVMGVTLDFSASYLMINLVVDILHYWLDPRLRIE